MRSCVVDADQLRAQVKRALAEMRALSPRPDADRFPALPASRTTGSTKRSSWFQLLVRTAADCFRPFFPARRTTSLARTDGDGRL
jgi:hypothetical protein